MRDRQPLHSQQPVADTVGRVLFWGTTSAFSIPPLRALLAAGIDVCGVILPGSESSRRDQASMQPLLPPRVESMLPVLNPFVQQTIAHLAWERSIPVFEARRLGDAATLSLLADLQPDVACVACFPWRIPQTVLALPRFGFLNVHPSLLPAYRGPAPLFWTFRNGDTQTGVTIHWMNESFDAGDITLQAPVELPDGVSGPEADHLCATLGGRLLVESLQRLAQGALSRRAQPQGGSAYSWPTLDDFTLSANWTARRAFNFMRGTAEWGEWYRIETAAGPVTASTALSFRPNDVLDRPVAWYDDEAEIQFTPGVVRVRLATEKLLLES